MSVIASGRRDRSARVLTVTSSPSAAPISAAVAADSRATGRARGAGQMRLAVLQPPVVQQHPPAGQHRLARAGRGPARRPRRSGRGARAVPGAQRGQFGAGRRDGRAAQVDAHLVGQGVQHPQVGWLALRCGSAAAKAAMRPSQLTKVPGLLRRRRDREHHVGAFGDRAVPQLQADHEPRGVQRGQRRVAGRRSRRARRRRPAARPACRRRRRPGLPSASRPGCGRQVGDVPALRHLRAGGRRRRAAGRRAAAPAAHRPPARRVRRRGAAPTPVGRRWLSASRAAADKPPGDRGQPFADQDDRAGFAQSSSPRRRRPAPSSAAASAPGAVSISVPPIFVSPRLANGAIGVHRQPVLAGGLAQPQEHDRRLLFGLEADQQHHRRRFQVGVGDGRSVGRRPAAARNSASSAECGRARKSMSLVPNTIRANLA